MDIDYSTHFNAFKKHAEFIMLTGSHSEGLQRKSSDIDAVIVVKKDNINYFRRNANCYLSLIVDNIITEILILSEDEYVEKIMSILGRDNLSIDVNFHELHRLIYGRLIFGIITCIDIEKVRNLFDDRYLKRQYFKIKKAYKNAMSDRNGHSQQQYYSSVCTYIKHTIEYKLFIDGDKYIRTRWLYSRIERTYGSSSIIFSEVNRIFFDNTDVGVNPLSSRADKLFSFSSLLQLSILDGGRDIIHYPVSEQPLPIYISMDSAKYYAHLGSRVFEINLDQAVSFLMFSAFGEGKFKEFNKLLNNKYEEFDMSYFIDNENFEPTVNKIV